MLKKGAKVGVLGFMTAAFFAGHVSPPQLELGTC